MKQNSFRRASPKAWRTASRFGARPLLLLLLAVCIMSYPAAPASAAPAVNTPPTLVTKDIALPGDGLDWRSSPLPGFALVQAKCQICHSAHYAEYQPTSSPRPYWEAQMKRMKNVFKAPIQDEDIPLLVDYLVKTYGSESGR